ncbi:MAG TPA: YdcF family protein [Gemmatimonadales bacterium]
MRRRWAVLLGAVGLAGIVYGTALALVWRAARADQRRDAGAIVVLGAAQYNGKPSPVLRARLDHALALYTDGLAPLIVVTGGIGSGDRESEATVGRRYLLGQGVADSAVVVVAKGRDTDETMAAVAEWVQGRALRDVLLVSDGFHLARLRVVARRHGLVAWTSPAPASPINGEREWGYFMAEGVKLPVAYLR